MSSGHGGARPGAGRPRGSKNRKAPPEDVELVDAHIYLKGLQELRLGELTLDDPDLRILRSRYPRAAAFLRLYNRLREVGRGHPHYKAARAGCRAILLAPPKSGLEQIEQIVDEHWPLR